MNKTTLTPFQYRVLRRKATERPFANSLWNETRSGLYKCAYCGQTLFTSDGKYESGTGWPSFWAPLGEGSVNLHKDYMFDMLRTEVTCSRCESHLGHLFYDGPEPTGMRYCINANALSFIPQVKVTEEDYSDIEY